MKKTFGWLLGVVFAVLITSSPVSPGEIKGLPASDVLGSEDIWDNATFVGGGHNGGATAHSEF